MFKTNDRVVDIAMGVSLFIAFMYAAMMIFDPDVLLMRYDDPSSNPDMDTLKVFLFWLGVANAGMITGIIYMGYKGMDRAFFAFAVPFLIFSIYWNITPAQNSGNFAGIILVSLGLLGLIIARARSGLPRNPFDIPKADSYFGTNDMVTKVLLFLGLIMNAFNVVIYFIRPEGLIEDSPFLIMSAEAQYFSMAMMFMSLAWVLTLLYQMRAGYSMTMIVVGLMQSTLMFVGMLNFMIRNNFSTTDGNPLLAMFITTFFVGSVILFFRNQSKA